MNSAQSALARRVLKFRVSRNCDKIILNFAKFEENFAKHEIKIFAKIWQNYKNRHFAATILLLLHNLPSAVCYSPSPPIY